MSVFTSLGILVTAMLIMALLQLTPGIFLLFRHYASGKYSARKASDLALFFILGVETAVVIFLLSLYFIITAISPTIIDSNNFFYWFMSTVFAILCFAFLFCYFRKGAGTRLFISRSLASKIDHKAKTIKSRSDAFTLGITSIIPELIFTLPLFIISIACISSIATESVLRSGLIILFAISAVLPLIIYNITFNIDHHLASLIKFRFKNKTFIRFFVSFLYLLLSIIIIIGIVYG